MFKNLLVCFLLLFSLSLYSQSTSNAAKLDLKIYPNPASNFIQLQEVSNVSSIIVYNLVGRKIRQFEAVKGKSYPIADLPKGMYLVQLMGLEGKVLTTQRLSKR